MEKKRCVEKISLLLEPKHWRWPFSFFLLRYILSNEVVKIQTMLHSMLWILEGIPRQHYLRSNAYFILQKQNSYQLFFSKQYLFSLLSALSKKPASEADSEFLICLLNTSIWLCWVLLHSGNAIQIWANGSYFKRLGTLIISQKNPVLLIICTCSSAWGWWESWLLKEVRFTF